MKYSVYINQKELSKTDFDLVDGAILDYLYFICNSKNEKIEKQRINGYTWVDYNKILTDNPLLRIKSKGALSRRIKKIKASGFIKVMIRRKNGHKLLYFQMTEKVDTLFISMNNPIHEKENPIHFENNPIHEDEPISTIKDNTIKNYSIKIRKKHSFIIPTIKEINSYCLERENNLDAEHFFDFYKSKDWKVGENKMKDWRACVRNWEKNSKKWDKGTSKKEYSKIDSQINEYLKGKELLK